MSDNQKGPSPLPARTRSARVGSQRKGSKQPKGKYRRFFNKKWILLVTVTSFLLIVGGCGAIVMTASTVPIENVDKVDYSSIVYNQQEEEVGKIGANYREYVTLEQINQVNPDLAMAFVKVEDKRYYEHNGVDFWGLARAVFKNIVAFGKAEGASTLTMQVAGNVVLENREKTYMRKVNEVFAALNLERKYSKEKILETYMNYITFGNRVKGVQMASKIYFGKDLTKDKLEPHEIALLAGLPKAPYGYNPYGSKENQERALNRRNVVLVKMAETEPIEPLITEEEKELYQKKSLGVNKEFLKKYIKEDDYQAYMDLVRDEIVERYGIDEVDLENGGYKIVTGINVKAQKAVGDALKNNELFKNDQNEENVNAGIAMVDPKTGLIMALGGGKTYQTGYNNWAIKSSIQPGSSIKPLTVFAPAVQEKNYNEFTPYKDEEYVYQGWKPKNYSQRYYGDVTLGEMVYRSLNASTSKMLVEDVNVSKSFNYGKKLGLPLQKNDEAPAPLALGGLTQGVSPLDMAQAYTVFPNNGNVVKAHAVLSLKKRDGADVKPLDDEHEIDEKGSPEQVFSPKTAWYVTRMLKQVVENPAGTGSEIKIGRPLAAKTGTTQNFDSGWAVGYTPDVVLAVTVFNDTIEGKKGKAEITGGSIPATLFENIMKNGISGPAKDFPKPQGVPDPQPPFQLKAPQLQGSYNAGSNAVQLSWSNQGARVKYKVQRSSDGSNFTDIRTVDGGSFTDTSISQPNLFDQITGGKKYYYRVVAIDTEASDDSSGDKEKVSNVVTITVMAKEQDDQKDDEDEDKDDEDKNDDSNDPGEDDDQDQPDVPGPPFGPGNGDDNGNSGPPSWWP